MLHQEAPLPNVAPLPGEGGLGHGAPLRFPVFLPGSHQRQWELKGSALSFEGWLVGAVPTAALFPPGYSPSLRTANSAQAAGGPIKPAGSTEDIELVKEITPTRFHCREVTKGSPGRRASIPAQPGYSQELPLNVKLELFHW